MAYTLSCGCDIRGHAGSKNFELRFSWPGKHFGLPVRHRHSRELDALGHSFIDPPRSTSYTVAMKTSTDKTQRESAPGAAARKLLELLKKLPKHRGRKSHISSHVKEHLYGLGGVSR